MIQEELKNRNLPKLLQMNDGTLCNTATLWEKRRAEILDLFSREVYGYMPTPPTDTTYHIISTYDDAVAGFAIYYRIRITFSTPKGPFSFDVEFYTPKTVIHVPLLLHLQFNDSPLHRVYPVEDIIKNGFATMLVRYCDIMPDKNDFSQGLAGMYLKGNQRESPTEWGAIGCWAFAASRIMDVIETMDFIDSKRVAIIGHSRLGKTAMWCAANDKRFALAVINASGNTGASLSRGNEGETIEDITKMFPHWFCENYYKYANHESEAPFDQHEIVAAIAPRGVYICSGDSDMWAGPKSEFLCALAASPVYEMLGLKGLVTPDAFPLSETCMGDGLLAYSVHSGGHYIGRFEWENIMKLMKNRYIN